MRLVIENNLEEMMENGIRCWGMVQNDWDDEKIC